MTNIDPRKLWRNISDDVQAIELCTGPHPACRAAHRRGLSAHVISNWSNLRLIMPTTHFASIADGVAAIEAAMLTAVTISNDDELYAARDAGVPHYLPIGWCDPTMRR